MRFYGLVPYIFVADLCKGLTFTSLKKTCRKLSISLWDYLHDRLSSENIIPLLPELILQLAKAP